MGIRDDGFELLVRQVEEEERKLMAHPLYKAGREGGGGGEEGRGVWCGVDQPVWYYVEVLRRV